MIYTRDEFTQPPQYPTYPSYHVGDYLEDYFRNRFIQESPSVGRDYIGISWTTLYVDNKRQGLQQFLDTLPRDGKYFTVCQHDDAPMERLPPDTLCFSAGGNIQTANTIPIPVVCSKLPITPIEDNHKRKLLASFVGSATHPIRISMYNVCKNMKDVYVYMRPSAPNISFDEFKLFLNASADSKFCLSPRGTAATSFRTYECIQLGCIPVIISDNPYLPWKDELDWSEFSVLITEKDLPRMEEILKSYSEEKITEMRNKGNSLWSSHFSLSGVYENIISRIK